MNSAQDAAQLLNTLKRERDELHLKLHLLKAEARDEWEILEKKFAELQSRSARVIPAASQAAENIGTAVDILGDEIRAGYRRIREALGAG